MECDWSNIHNAFFLQKVAFAIGINEYVWESVKKNQNGLFDVLSNISPKDFVDILYSDHT